MEHDVRIFLHVNSYPSHARVAADYAQIFAAAGHQLVRDPTAADICFLHDEPQRYETILQRLPPLKCFKVGFAVFEATPLPPELERGLVLVDELWVPSEFCRAVFADHHPRVRVVPHVVARDSAADRSICDAFALSPGKRRLLHVTRGFDKRKGTEQLLRVFSALQSADVELVIKGAPSDERIRQDGVAHIRMKLSDAQMTALYLASDAYVSPHFGEGWGLGLSDALWLGRRAIATDWSGNVDFMRTPDGQASPLSVLVPAHTEPIRPSDRYLYFRGEQQWAYVKDEDLARATAETLALPPPNEDELRRERQNLARFSPEAVREKIEALIGQWP